VALVFRRRVLVSPAHDSVVLLLDVERFLKE
jgi:hypothetical protein